VADYYTILGVSRNATQREIREAYVRLAKGAHPDRFKDPAERSEAERRFQEITESFNNLRDEKLRGEYDKSLARRNMTPRQEAALYHKNAKLREELKDYTEALRLYYEAMRLEPDNVDYILAAANVLSRDRSKQREAAELYEKAISKDQKSRESYLGLGSLYESAGLMTRACRVYQRGAVEIPDDAELKKRLSRARAQRGRMG